MSQENNFLVEESTTPVPVVEIDTKEHPNQGAFIHTDFENIVKENDLVLVYISKTNIRPVVLHKNGRLNTKYGTFLHSEIIGKKYGSQIGKFLNSNQVNRGKRHIKKNKEEEDANNDEEEDEKKFGFIHVLKPTPELWTLSLPHRTQIVYTFDSSYITERLQINSLSNVIEAGTGSGSLSHQFSRSCGKLFTYEFHEVRKQQAELEFQQHGLLYQDYLDGKTDDKNTANIVINHRDVCKNGFLIDQVENIDADCVFLDLPAPWEAIPNLNKPGVMNQHKQVRVCCFSPCFEQVDKTVEALEANGWGNIEMVEIQGKNFEGRKRMVKTIDDAIKVLCDQKERRNMGTINYRNYKKAKQDLEEGENNDGHDLKRLKTNSTPADEKFNPFGKGMRVKEGDEKYEWSNVCKIESEIKSHTSYLTFATKIFKISRQE
ncbi:hypothetical protein QEN19_000203 [Hanseniaspora menglaensis]